MRTPVAAVLAVVSALPGAARAWTLHLDGGLGGQTSPRVPMAELGLRGDMLLVGGTLGPAMESWVSSAGAGAGTGVAVMAFEHLLLTTTVGLTTRGSYLAGTIAYQEHYRGRGAFCWQDSIGAFFTVRRVLDGPTQLLMGIQLGFLPIVVPT